MALPTTTLVSPAALPAAAAPRPRLWELDAARGLMLVLMLSTHLPTRFAIPASQPFGFVSAAEGFVLLSAYMAGRVYTRLAQRDGLPAMQRAFLQRAVKVYACQAASLLFLFTVIAGLGLTLPQPDVQHLMWFYLHDPVTALLASLALIYNPPLLDILPIYVMFMLLSPWVLSRGLRHGWRGILLFSAGLWLAAQFGVSHLLYGYVTQWTGLPVPFSETGAFETFAWQALWVFGLWLGARHGGAADGPTRPFPRWMVAGAVVTAIVFFLWRHITGHDAFPHGSPANLLFDKWHLGPLRLLNVGVLVLLAMHFDPWIRQNLPRVRWLETLGQASLPVFCAHLVIVLLAISALGTPTPARPGWVDAAMYVCSVIALYGVARVALGKRGMQEVGDRKAALSSGGPR